MKQLMFVAAAALLCPLTVGAQATAQQPSYPRVDFVEDSLPNGLKVIYHADRATPVVSVNVWYNVGSKHEAPGRTGFAHLFEHIMFKGSRNVPDGQHFAMLEAAGGRAGADINGTTSFDRTNYFQTVPSNQLELALWLEADRMGTLLDVLTQEKLDNQREVVKNERRQGVDNQPYGTWFEKMLSHAYPAGHPYHHTVIGSMDDLSAATLDDVKTFFRTYYAPNNAVVVLAGDLDVDAARALVRKHFGWIPRGPAPPPLRDASLPPVLGETKREAVEDPLAVAPAVYVGFRVPSARDPRAPQVNLLAGLLAGGRSSHLHRILVTEKQIATNVFGFNFGVVDGSDLLVFGATGRPGTHPDSLERALIDALGQSGQAITQAELERVRQSRRFQFVNGLQTTGGFGGRADRLAEGWTYYRDANFVNTILPSFDAVTVHQLHALATERLVPQNRVTMVYVPRPAAQKVVP